LAIFGNDVVERVFQPAYYWTRFGYIFPGLALTNLFGPIEGLEILRLILLAALIAGYWVAIRSVARPITTAFIVILLLLNTVPLGYLGNPYPTAVIVVGMVWIVALGVNSTSRAKSLALGAILAWLGMTNPYGTVLSIVLLLLVVLGRWGLRQAPAWIRECGLWLAVGLVGVASAFLLVGRIVFPNRDWLSTYIFWNSALNQEDYIFEYFRWTYDQSLLFPVLVAFVALVNYIRGPRSSVSRVAVYISLGIPIFSVSYWYAFPNNYLEIPHYQALLWPPALVSLGLIVADRLRFAPVNRWRILVAVTSIAAVYLVGHVDVDLTVAHARKLAVITALLIVLVPRNWIAITVGLALVLSSGQILQSSRDNFGVSTEYLYENVFRENTTKLTLTSAVAAETFILERTSPGDRTISWVDADWEAGEEDLVPLAAFHLWGPNGTVRGSIMTEDAVTQWEGIKPISVVMYGKSMESVLEFWNSIPKNLRPSVPECIQVAWPSYEGVEVCVTKLSW